MTREEQSGTLQYGEFPQISVQAKHLPFSSSKQTTKRLPVAAELIMFFQNMF